MFTTQNKIHPFMQEIFINDITLTCKDVIAHGPSSGAKNNFEELIAVKWLTCSFGPVETDSGEILDFIGFDRREKRTRIFTVPLDESKVIKEFVIDKDSPFAKPMILVFDTGKSRVQLVYGSKLFDTKENSATSLINVQKVDWLTPGALQLTITVSHENSSLVLNLVIYAGNKIEEKFRALANFTLFGAMIVMSAQCSDNIDQDIFPEVKENQLNLEAAGAGSKED
jgi:hypothetical protein